MEIIESEIQRTKKLSENHVFSASSMEDVAFYFDALPDSGKENDCLCFEIRVDGLLDTESILEASRWLCSHSAKFVPSIPLEPSALFALDKMRPEAICVELIYAALGDLEIKYSLLETVLERLQSPVWISTKGLSATQWERLKGFSIARFLTELK